MISGELMQDAKPQKCSFSELNAKLDELAPAAIEIQRVKHETAILEASTLESIIKKIVPFLSFLSPDCGQYYRRELTIATEDERIPLNKTCYFYNESSLVLYENGILTRRFRYGELSTDGAHPCWEMVEEHNIDAMVAISFFGIEAIVEGLAKALESIFQT